MTVVIVGAPDSRKSFFAETMRDTMDQFGFTTALVHDEWSKYKEIPEDLSRDTVHIYVITENPLLLRIKEKEKEIETNVVTIGA